MQILLFTNNQGTINFAFNNSNNFEPLKSFRQESIKSNLNVVTLHFENESVGLTPKTARRKIAQYLWDTFGTIPVATGGVEGTIERPFLHFTEYTDVYDIWYWFEAEFDLSVGKDLMKM